MEIEESPRMDLEYAALIGEEALDRPNGNYPGLSHSTRRVLGMAEGRGKRWLVGRLRSQRLGDQEEFRVPAAAALAAVELVVALRNATFGHWDVRGLGGVSKSTLRLPNSPD